MSSMAQATSEPPPGFMTIQTISVSSHSVPIVTDTCIGDGCLGTATETHCYDVCVADPCFACSTTTEGQLSVLPITTSVSIHLPEDTTGLLSITGSDTGGTVTASGGSSGSATASTTAPPHQSTGAAPPGQSTNDSGPILLAMALSALSITLGLAWTLL